MHIQFGESVRHFRTAMGMTQEQLARRVSVTFQTVSKWEHDECYPDLTMLPVLAQIFGVSTDQLLGVDESENERRTQEIIDAYDNHKPDTATEHLPKLKESVGEFPLDYRLWVRYMECRLYCARGLEGGQEAAKETREIYENIQAHCRDDSIRMWAKRLFVMHLHSLAQSDPSQPEGDAALQEECEAILREMPALRTCREHIATMVTLPGKAHIRAVQQELVKLLWMFRHAVAHHEVYGNAFPGERHNDERAAQIVEGQELMLQMVELLCPEGDYGELAVQVIYCHGYLAFYRAVLGDTGEAYAALRRACELAAAFDAQPQVTTHSSPLLVGLTYDKSKHDRGMAERMAELFDQRYPWPEGFAQDERFSEAMKALGALVAG